MLAKGPGHRKGPVKYLEVMWLEKCFLEIWGQAFISLCLKAFFSQLLLYSLQSKAQDLDSRKGLLPAGTPTSRASLQAFCMVLLKLRGRLRDLDPLHAGLQLELLHQAQQGAHAGPGRHGSGLGSERTGGRPVGRREAGRRGWTCFPKAKSLIESLPSLPLMSANIFYSLQGTYVNWPELDTINSIAFKRS